MPCLHQVREALREVVPRIVLDRMYLTFPTMLMLDNSI